MWYCLGALKVTDDTFLNEVERSRLVSQTATVSRAKALHNLMTLSRSSRIRVFGEVPAVGKVNVYLSCNALGASSGQPWGWAIAALSQQAALSQTG